MGGGRKRGGRERENGRERDETVNGEARRAMTWQGTRLLCVEACCSVAQVGMQPCVFNICMYVCIHGWMDGWMEV